LIASILKTKFRREGDEPIRPPFERRVRDRRALVPVDPLAPVSIKRREGDRRRALPWLLPPPPRST
jgi:hypothetical protein